MREVMRIKLPDMPDAFDQAVEDTLSAISRMEREAGVPQARGKKRIRAGVVIIAATLLFSLATLALALSGRVFTLKPNYTENPRYVDVQESAYPLVRRDLASMSLAHTDLNVLEAVFDGQELRVVYSITDRAVKEVFTGMPEENYNQMVATMEKDFVRSCDGLRVNGEYVNPQETAVFNGENPGELVFYLQVNTRESNVIPEGDFTVTLPIPYDTEDAAKQLSFKLNADEASKYTHTASAFEMEHDGVHVKSEKLLFTPMRGYVTMLCTVKDAKTMEEAYTKVEKLISNVKLFLPDGTEVLGGLNGWGDVVLEDGFAVRVECYFTPPPKWTDTMRLVPQSEGKPVEELTVELHLK